MTRADRSQKIVEAIEAMPRALARAQAPPAGALLIPRTIMDAARDAAAGRPTPPLDVHHAARRERWAALGHAAILVGQTDYPDPVRAVDQRPALSDLLANVMHYAEREGLDFGAALAAARADFRAEAEGRPEDSERA